jgi:DNA-binding CsgD family transcriptional regulator
LPTKSERSSPFAAAVVLFNHPVVTIDDLLGSLMREYHMTRAEPMLAAALATGSTLSDYAKLAGVSRNTVRSQLQQATGKAGAKGQTDLVRIILSGISPP